MSAAANSAIYAGLKFTGLALTVANDLAKSVRNDLLTAQEERAEKVVRRWAPPPPPPRLCGAWAADANLGPAAWYDLRDSKLNPDAASIEGLRLSG